MVASLADVWAMLLTAWQADAGLSALRAVQPIYRGLPTTPIQYPAISIAEIDANPDTALSIPARFRPDLQVNVYARHPDQCDAIAAYLQQNWSIPQTRSQGLGNSEWTIRSLIWRAQRSGGEVRITSTDEWVYWLILEAKLHVVRRTSSS